MLFSSLTDPASLAAASMLADFLGMDDFVMVKQLLSAFEAGESEIPLLEQSTQRPIKPDVAAFWSRDTVVIVCSGTENAAQLLDAAWGAKRTTRPGVTGLVADSWANQAGLIATRLLALGVEDLLPTRKLVLIGHSRG